MDDSHGCPNPQKWRMQLQPARIKDGQIVLNLFHSKDNRFDYHLRSYQQLYHAV